MLGLIKLYTVPRYRRMMKGIAKDAKKRGLNTSDYMRTLGSSDLARYLIPPIKPMDVERFGLPPDAKLIKKPLLSKPVRDAKVAHAAGDWQPGADLLAGTGQDWDRRSSIVSLLGEVAADDDTALKSWRAARPDDADAAAVHADALTNVAWQIRSARRAKYVSAEQFAGFQRVLGEADEASQTAAELAPDDPTPWATRCMIAMGRQYGHEEFRAVWDGVMSRDPLHVHGHARALQYWCAKWFGTHDLMWTFAEEGTSASKPRSSNSGVVPKRWNNSATSAGARPDGCGRTAVTEPFTNSGRTATKPAGWPSSGDRSRTTSGLLARFPSKRWCPR